MIEKRASARYGREEKETGEKGKLDDSAGSGPYSR
jgi:hypothetical protein